MNNRIKELIEQATTVEKGPMVFGPNPYNSEIVTFNKEKFAELIINETMAVVYDTRVHAITKFESEDRKNLNEFMVTTSCSAYTDAVDKHFGIKNECSH